MIELVRTVHRTARGRLRAIAPTYATQNHLPIRAKLPNMRLMQFPQALETVLRTLERMREERAHRPCASRSVLDALNRVATFRTSDNVRETKIDPPSPSLRRAGI